MRLRKRHRETERQRGAHCLRLRKRDRERKTEGGTLLETEKRGQRDTERGTERLRKRDTA